MHQASSMVVLVVALASLVVVVSGGILDDPRKVNTQCYWTPPSSVMTPPLGFCATEHATGLGSVRGIVIDIMGRPIVINGDGLIRMVADKDASGFSESDEWTTIFNVPSLNLNGAMLLNGPYMYVSSPTAIYRFVYDFLEQPMLVTSYTTVVSVFLLIHSCLITHYHLLPS
jgi:hypothetical protein